MKSANPNPSNFNPNNQKQTTQTGQLFDFLAKQKWITYLLIFSSMAIIAIAIIRIITPPQVEITPSPELTTNTSQLNANFSNITFTGQEIEVPNKLTVFSLEQNVNNQSTITSLIEQFSFEQNQYVDTVWNSDTHSLSYQADAEQYTLIQNTETQNYQNLPAPINQQQAIQTAQNYIKQILPSYSDLTPAENSIIYFQGGIHPEFAQPEEATWMLIPYTLQIENTPVFYKKSGTFPLEILVNSNDEVIKVTFTSTPVRYSSLQQNNTISIATAIQNINQQQATVISVFNQGTQDLSLESVISGEMNTVQLEYRVDETNRLIYPYYRFFGTVVNNAGDSFEVEIITPAIKTLE